MKAKKKIPLSLSAAAVLLSLVLISAHFTSGMYARYAASTSGSDFSRTALFRVSAKAESETPVTITAGERENLEQRISGQLQQAGCGLKCLHRELTNVAISDNGCSDFFHFLANFSCLSFCGCKST